MRRCIALFVPLAIACSASPNSPGEIRAQREQWAERTPQHYQFDQDVICFCVPPHAVRIEVRAGAIVAMTNRETGAAVPQPNWGAFYTIEGLFDLIAEAARMDPARLDVTYHPTDHYPTSVSIDYQANWADDEVTIKVVALTPMP